MFSDPFYGCGFSRKAGKPGVEDHTQLCAQPHQHSPHLSDRDAVHRPVRTAVPGRREVLPCLCVDECRCSRPRVCTSLCCSLLWTFTFLMLGKWWNCSATEGVMRYPTGPHSHGRTACSGESASSKVKTSGTDASGLTCIGRHPASSPLIWNQVTVTPQLCQECKKISINIKDYYAVSIWKYCWIEIHMNSLERCVNLVWPV